MVGYYEPTVAYVRQSNGENTPHTHTPKFPISVYKVQILAVGFYKILLVHFLLSFIVAVYVLGHTLKGGGFKTTTAIRHFVVFLEVGISTVTAQYSDKCQLHSPLQTHNGANKINQRHLLFSRTSVQSTLSIKGKEAFAVWGSNPIL